MHTHVSEPSPNAKAFIECLVDLQSSWQNSRRRIFIWRGVGDFDQHKLIPSALREINSAHLLRIANLQPKTIYHQLNDNLKQAYLEFRIVEGFLKLADRSGLSLPELPPEFRNVFDEFAAESRQSEFEKLLTSWPHRDIMPLISLAQHYGLPTRALDWSHNALTAAYFAGESALREIQLNGDQNTEDKYLAVWWANPYDLIETEQRDSLTKELKLRFEVSEPPRFQNPNLNAQSGVFTWISGPASLEISVAKTPLDIIANDLKRGAPSNANRTIGSFMVQRLAWRHADELVSRLFNLDISRATLQPGFGGVADAMKVLSQLQWEPG